MAKFILPVFAAFALSLAPMAAQAKGCKGLTGKELKACEKEKADANKGVAMKPSEVDPSWSNMDGAEKNPFNKPKYSVRYEPTGIKKVDNYLKSAAAIKGKMAMATYMTDQAGVGNVDLVTKSGPALVKALAALPTDAQALVGDGKTLIADLPKILTGPDAMKIPKITKGLNGAIGNLASAIKLAPETSKSLASVVKDPGKAAAGAADGATKKK